MNRQGNSASKATLTSLILGLVLSGCQTTPVPSTARSAPTEQVKIRQAVVAQNATEVRVEYEITPVKQSWVSFNDGQARPGVAWFEGEEPMRLTLTAKLGREFQGHQFGVVSYSQKGEMGSRSGGYEFPADAVVPINQQVSFGKLPPTLKHNTLYIIASAFGPPLYLACSDDHTRIPLAYAKHPPAPESR